MFRKRPRRLVPVTPRVVNATRGAHLYPSVINTVVGLDIPMDAIPDRLRDGDFNTRVATRRLFVSGGALSQFILREGFPDADHHMKPRTVALSSKPGDMLAVRNPTGNSQPAQNTSWGHFLDRYAKENHK